MPFPFRLDALAPPSPRQVICRRILRLGGVLLGGAAIALAQAHAQSALTIDPGGRVHVDALSSFADAGAPASYKLALRRARLGLAASVGDEWVIDSEINVSDDGSVDAKSVFIQYAPRGSVFSFLVGQVKTPNSFDEMNSSNYATFNERAEFTRAFEFDRALGGAVAYSDGSRTVTAGIFAENINDGAFSGGYAAGARATAAPIMTEARTLHLGASVRYREAGDKQRFDYDLRPTTPASATPSLDAGVRSSSDIFLGAEAVLLAGNIWAAGEVAYLDTESGPSNGDDVFHGGYVEAGFSLGGSQTYKNGKLGAREIEATVFEDGPGALFAAIRYDHIDLARANGGSSRQTLKLGIDWFASDELALRFNIFTARTQGEALLSSPFSKEARRDTGASLRTQILF